MSWVVACGKLNLLFCAIADLISMIFPTVFSSSKEFAESPNEDGLVPEDFSTILIKCLLKISLRIYSSLTSSSFTSMLIWPSEEHPSFVGKGFGFSQNSLFVIKPYFAVFLK